MPKNTSAKSHLSPRAAKSIGSRSRTRAGKQIGREQRVFKLLRRSQGVSIDELVATFGVQPHTARAMVSVFGRKAGGVERRDGRYRVVG